MAPEAELQDEPARPILEEALEAADHEMARFHIRHALQYLLAETE